MTETMLLPVSESLTSAPGSTPSAAPGRPGLVRRALRDTGYALGALPLGVVSLVVVVAGVSLAAGLLVLGVGVLVLAATVVLCRGLAHAERVRLRSLQGREAPAPHRLRSAPGDGLLRRWTTPLRDPQGWLDLLWGLVSPVTATVAATVVLSWWGAVLNGATYWFWQRYLPQDGDTTGLAELMGLGSARSTEIWLQVAIGVVALVTLPAAVRVAALVHGGTAHLLLCSRAELQGEVRRVTGSRDSARRAEADALRRLERDIHDGPQQRLVRLGLDLGRARAQVDRDPAQAAVVLDGALVQARETVAELRALSRGIAPPLLVDRGLAAAVREMAAGSAVPVRTRVEVPVGLPVHVETTVYFVAAEALTNIAKHSGASRAELEVVADDDRVVVRVVDDGEGGAAPTAGHGLAGLEERLAGVEGRLEIRSPRGGPTMLLAEVPLR